MYSHQVAFDGLIQLAAKTIVLVLTTASGTAFASESLTAADLLAMRKKMGKYGINPSEVLYIVNQTRVLQPTKMLSSKMLT